jgi:hypothetical protein
MNIPVYVRDRSCTWPWHRRPVKTNHTSSELHLPHASANNSAHLAIRRLLLATPRYRAHACMQASVTTWPHFSFVLNTHAPIEPSFFSTATQCVLTRQSASCTGVGS